MITEKERNKLRTRDYHVFRAFVLPSEMFNFYAQKKEEQK